MVETYFLEQTDNLKIKTRHGIN